MSRSFLDTFIKLEHNQMFRHDDLIIIEPEDNIIPVLSHMVGELIEDEYALRRIDMFDFIQQTKMEFINTAKIRELMKSTNDPEVLRVMIEQLCQQLDIIYK